MMMAKFVVVWSTLRLVTVCVVCDIVQELKMCYTRMENASVDSRQWTTFYSIHNYR